LIRHVPNLLTLLRFLLIPALVLLLARGDYAAAFAALFVSAVSDFADGVIAREWNARTRFGAVADPVVDKATMLAVTLTLGATRLLPLWLVAAIVLRDVVIVGGALAYHYVIGRFDIAPTFLSKLNTAIEFGTLALVIATAAGIVQAEPALPTLFAVLLATIAASGAQYVWVWGRRAIAQRGGGSPSSRN
jgi:cardiolipin synthase (CMP-forming)